jgi:16S rRNA (cytosine967-C5)-methyltransferase
VSRFHSYLNSAEKILLSYKGKEPFASFIKEYFSAHKKYGSKDRKQISHLCYCCFRLGKAGDKLPLNEKILAGLFVCSDEPSEVLQHLKPEWNEKVRLTLKQKLSSVSFQLSSVFPWKEELSEDIDHEKFSTSFFIQPDLFLRIRPGHTEKAMVKLDQENIAYKFIPPSTLRLANSFKTDKYFDPDKEVVVQDYNSQRVGEFLPVRPGQSDRIWDCCAASGGKSIMAYDLDPSIDLAVSDVRESILINLRKRFEKAGIKRYRSFVTDLSHSPLPTNLPVAIGAPFDLIIADVPCTGSGTWSRTPEQLVFFDTKKIEEYSALQKKIVSNLIPYLKPGGQLVYITCSVFKKENEEIVRFIKDKFHLHIKKMELLKGYEIKADSMFAAILSLPEQEKSL